MATPNPDPADPAGLAREVATDLLARPLRRWTFGELLAKVAPAQWSALSAAATRLRAATEVASVPVIGVCGMMNSGKSTLAAYFLSSEGRSRVLIGDGAREGTHRFVLWAPAKWREDAERQATLERLLQASFPMGWERLAEEPEAAFAQYNASTARLEAFERPLIAYDTALDAHGLALLDCPDIQRPHGEVASGSRGETAAMRREALARAVQLCSAFFVVSRLDAFGDERFHEILALVHAETTRLPFFLIVTKLPEGQQGRLLSELAEEGLPSGQAVFYSPYLPGAPARGYPYGIAFHSADGKAASLEEVIQSLEPAQLQQGFLNERRTDLSHQIAEAKAALAEVSSRQQGVFTRARETLLSFLERQFMSDDGGLRMVYSPEVAEALLESLQRTAPWYLKLGLLSQRHLRDFTRLLARKGKELVEFVRQSPFRKPGEEELAQLSTIRPRQFAQAMQGHAWLPGETRDADLATICERALFAMMEKTEIDQATLRRELDAQTALLWWEVPLWRKGLAAVSFLLTIAGMLAALLMIPLDGGVTIATVTELLAASGVLGLLTHAAAVASIQTLLEEHAGRPQVAALFAFLQDALAIPRADAAYLRASASNQQLRIGVYTGSGVVTPIITLMPEPVFELTR